MENDMRKENGRVTPVNKESADKKEKANMICPNCNLKAVATIVFGEDNYCERCSETLERLPTYE